MKIYDSSGAFLGIHERALAPFSSQVIFDLLSPWRGAEGLRVEIETMGEARLRVYASTVEASTGDAVFIPASEPGK